MGKIRKLVQRFKTLFSGDPVIPTREGMEAGMEAPPDGTPAKHMIIKYGDFTSVWIEVWHELTIKDGLLQFPRWGYI